MKSTQAASVSNHLRLSDGVCCVDYHRTFRALAVGSTRQLHIVEVVCAMAKDTRVRQLLLPSSSSADEDNNNNNNNNNSSAHSPFVLRNAGVFGGLQKVEHVTWYPSADEATLAFVQPGRSVTIFLDALLFRADGTYIPQQWTRSRGKGKVLHASMEAGGGPTASAVVGGMVSSNNNNSSGGSGHAAMTTTMMMCGTPLTRTSTTPCFTPQFASATAAPLAAAAKTAAASHSSLGTSMASRMSSGSNNNNNSTSTTTTTTTATGATLPGSATTAPHMSSPLTATPPSSVPATTTAAATTTATVTVAAATTARSPSLSAAAAAAAGGAGVYVTRELSGAAAKEPIELVINTAYLRVRKIAWDPHEPYTLALTSPTTHFELWRVPVDGVRVYAPQLVLRPPAHDSRSVAVDIAFAPADRYCLVVMTETAQAGQLLVYDRRHVEVPRRIDTAGPGLAAAWHPAFTDLLCVCYRKQKTRPECRIAFVRLSDDNNNGGGSSSSTEDDNKATVGGNAVHTAATTTTRAAAAVGDGGGELRSLLPPLDHYATVVRLRWRPPCGGVLVAANAQHTYLTHQPSLAGLALGTTTVRSVSQQPSQQPSQRVLDELLSQLWLGTLSTTTDADIHVWDVTRPDYPIATVRFVCKEGKEPVDFVWLNELTLAAVLQGGEVVVTSVVNNIHIVDTPAAAAAGGEGAAAGGRGRSNAAITAAHDAESDTTRGDEAAVLARARTLYAHDEMADVMSLYSVLPNAVVVADWFGGSYVVRSSAMALKAYYVARVQRECVALMRRLLQHDDVERRLQQQRRQHGGSSNEHVTPAAAAATTTTTTTAAVTARAVEHDTVMAHDEHADTTSTRTVAADTTHATRARSTHGDSNSRSSQYAQRLRTASGTLSAAPSRQRNNTLSLSSVSMSPSMSSRSRVSWRAAVLPWARVFGRASQQQQQQRERSHHSNHSRAVSVTMTASTTQHGAVATTTTTAGATASASPSPSSSPLRATVTRYGQRTEDAFAMAVDALTQHDTRNNNNNNSNIDQHTAAAAAAVTSDVAQRDANEAAALTPSVSSSSSPLLHSMAIAPLVPSLLQRAHAIQTSSSSSSTCDSEHMAAAADAGDDVCRRNNNTAMTVHNRANDVYIECFAVADAVCAAGAYVERCVEQRRFVRYALQWNMGYEVALSVRRLRHGHDDAVRRAAAVAAAAGQQQQQQQHEEEEQQQAEQQDDDEKEQHDDDVMGTMASDKGVATAADVDVVPMTRRTTTRAATRQQQQQTPHMTTSSSAVVDAHAISVDNYFARLLLTNARICEDADDDADDNDDDATAAVTTQRRLLLSVQSSNNNNNSSSSSSSNSSSSSSSTRKQADAPACRTTATATSSSSSSSSSAGDCRALWWRAAAHAWRSHARDVIVTVTTSQLEYASLVGDVQYCLVLYILFCLWWRLRHTPLCAHDDVASGGGGGNSDVIVGGASKRKQQQQRQQLTSQHVMASCPLMPGSNDSSGSNNNTACTLSSSARCQQRQRRHRLLQQPCTAAQWKLRALQWLETYTLALYAHKLYVPLNELLLIMPEITQQPCNPVQPRAADIAYEKQMTYVYCATCPRSQLCARALPPPAPLAVAAVPTHTTTTAAATTAAMRAHDDGDDSDDEDSLASSAAALSLSSSSSLADVHETDTQQCSALPAAAAAATRDGQTNTTMTTTAAAAAVAASAAVQPLCSPSAPSLPHNATCPRCESHTAMTCVVCNAVVEGMYYWLRSCGHGGHVHHMEEWLLQCDVCPLCGVPVSSGAVTTSAATTTTTTSAMAAGGGAATNTPLST